VTSSACRRLPSLLLLAALAACGPTSDSDAPQAATEKVDACALFTYEDAKAIAGESLAGMASTLDEARGRDPSECIYNSGSLEQPRILSLLVRYHRSPKAAARVQKSSRSSFRRMSGGKVQDVPGLGEGALWVGGRIQQLHVLTGDKQLVITAHSPDGTDQLPQARQIAVKVLERLESGAPAHPSG
jgi:hypothetical protein